MAVTCAKNSAIFRCADCTSPGVSATFAINTYTVTASAGANGSLDASTPSPATVNYNTTTSFKFNANANYHVASVSGCGGTAYNNTSNAVTTYTYTTGAITADCTSPGVSATFAINTYTVTYDGNGNTGGTAPVDGNSPYNYNATVTVLGNTGALVKTGYTFNNWNTAANGSGTSYAPAATFTMGAVNVTLYAQWTINTYTVTANATGTGTGIVTSDVGGISYSYPTNSTGTTSAINYGTSVTLTASVVSGSLAAWNDCAGAGGVPSGNGTSTATCAFSSLDGNKSVTATFTLNNNTSVSSATGQGDITLSVDNGCGFTSVQASAANGDTSYSYPYGLVAFTINCATADVTITFPGDVSGMTYRKYGPTTPGDTSTTQWYTFTNVTISGNTVTLHLQDGQLGDDTAVDGVIVDAGGPAQPAPAQNVSIPTMTEWGSLLFLILAGLASVYFIRKRRVS